MPHAIKTPRNKGKNDILTLMRILQGRLNDRNLEIKILRRRLSQKKADELGEECAECERKEEVIGTLMLCRLGRKSGP